MKKALLTNKEEKSHPSAVCLPIFDDLSKIGEQNFNRSHSLTEKKDFEHAQAFLLSYRGNKATFLAYRREIERLLQWSWHIGLKSIHTLKRVDIENYIAFCQNPPLAWIGTKKVPRFVEKEQGRIPNSEWRPFIATVSKSAHRKGYQADCKQYTLSSKSLREIFIIISSFYQFLIREQYATLNPILHIRQKSHYFQVNRSKAKIRRLSELQWHYVIETAELMAASSKEHERTLFIITILYSLYLRISELAASRRWIPKMGDFHRDSHGLWWFTTVGKGNKERQIAVSDHLIHALERYRLSRGLTPLPPPNDNTPLIPKIIGKGPVTSTSQIRVIVQKCFDQAILRLKKDHFTLEAQLLQEATVHWLRHTGISEDVKHRPREHVRDDAGHSSSITTDRYIDIELQARHASGKKKMVKPEL